MPASLFKTALLTLIGVCATAAVAQADVIYTFKSTSAVNNGTSSAVTGTLPLTLTLDITDAAAQSGRFALNGSGTGANPVFTVAGSPAAPTGLVSFTIATGSTVASITQTFLSGTINSLLVFNAAGQVSSSLLAFSGPVNSAVLNGTGTSANGYVGELANPCGADATSGICSVSGSWTRTVSTTAVPEPASLALLGLPLLVSVVRRSRRRVG